MDSQTFFNRGVRQYRSGNYRQAIRHLTDAIRIDPTFVMAYHYRGLCHHDIHTTNDAIRDFTQVIERDPRYAPAYEHRGNCYFRLKDYKAAVLDYDIAFALNPSSNILFRRSQAKKRLNELKEAIHDISAVISSEPKSLDLNFRGELKRAMNHVSAAIEDFNLAILLNPDRNINFISRAKCNFELQCYDEALSDCAKALELKHTSTPFNIMGLVHLKTGQIENSIANFTQAILLNTREPIYYYNRSTAHFSNRDLSSALYDADDSILLGGDIDDFYRNRGWVHCALKNFVKAHDDFQKAVEISPDNPLNLCSRAYGKLWLRDHQSAIKDAFTAMEMEPHDTIVYSSCAIVLLGCGLYDRAMEKFQISTLSDPYNDIAWRYIALLKYFRADYQAAVDDAKQSLLILGMDINPYVVYIFMQLKLGNKMEAKKTLCQARQHCIFNIIDIDIIQMIYDILTFDHIEQFFLEKAIHSITIWFEKNTHLDYELVLVADLLIQKDESLFRPLIQLIIAHVLAANPNVIPFQQFALKKHFPLF